MTKEQKAAYSRSCSKFVFVVFDNNNEVYTSTRRLLSHAMEDAKACKGEIWVAGRCTVPAHNIY